jgi:hypothetical protein
VPQTHATGAAVRESPSAPAAFATPRWLVVDLDKLIGAVPADISCAAGTMWPRRVERDQDSALVMQQLHPQERGTVDVVTMAK